ncbi:MAG TPA: MoaD/ThiS family protein [Dehalococcoidia bacterium]|nr:MoaD/ThiS family protein [Dehalococcoidia bacterium]
MSGTATSVSVRVLPFGVLHEHLFSGDLRCAAPATVRDVWRAAGGDAAGLAAVRAARNHDMCSWDTAVADGDEVAFMPPVSGG